MTPLTGEERAKVLDIVGVGISEAALMKLSEKMIERVRLHLRAIKEIDDAMLSNAEGAAGWQPLQNNWRVNLRQILAAVA